MENEAQAMALWLQIVIAAGVFFVACVSAIIGLLMLVEKRVSRMEAKIEATRQEAREDSKELTSKIESLNSSLTEVKEDVAVLKGRLLFPPDPGTLNLIDAQSRRRKTP